MLRETQSATTATMHRPFAKSTQACRSERDEVVEEPALMVCDQ